MPIAPQLAPTGRLRVAVWTVPYFAHGAGDSLAGIVPDLAADLARSASVMLTLMPFGNPAQIVGAFRDGWLDATFLGITADRAEAIDFGPVLFELQTSYLVSASSGIGGFAELDRAGVRIAVPAKSAQETYLAKTITAATLLPIPPETPQRAVDMLKADEADAFSHVAPMLAAVQGALPGSRILPGSYFNVPVAIGVAKGRGPDVGAFAQTFAEQVKRSGALQAAIDRAGVTGIAVAR